MAGYRFSDGRIFTLKVYVPVAITLAFASCNAYADISDLRWMTGCWAATGQESGSIEQWSSPAGGTMFGFSRVVSNGKTVAFEYLRIVTEERGVIALIASPSGQETARFELKEMSENKVVFENPDHDFPQTIIYQLDVDENLVGRIEGSIDGAPRAADFPMKRMSCDNGAREQR